MPSKTQTLALIRTTNRVVEAKTSSYTVTKSDFGKTFTTRGAGGAVTFTLPAASGNSGASVRFIALADQNMTVAGQDEEIVYIDDLTADSVTFSTASEKIGGVLDAFCDGTSWILMSPTTNTITPASA